MKNIDQGGSFFPRPDLGKAHFDDIEAYPGFDASDLLTNLRAARDAALIAQDILLDNS